MLLLLANIIEKIFKGTQKTTHKNYFGYKEDKKVLD